MGTLRRVMDQVLRVFSIVVRMSTSSGKDVCLGHDGKETSIRDLKKNLLTSLIVVVAEIMGQEASIRDLKKNHADLWCPRWKMTTYGQEVDLKDDEVEAHGEDHGTEQPNVLEGRHHCQGLVLRDATM